MPIEPTRQDSEKDTQAELPTDNKPADVKELTKATEGSLPADAKERTKAEFEKLTKANRELKAKLEGKQTQQKQSVLDSLRPQAVVPPVAPKAPRPEVKQDDFVDAEGYVDTALLKNSLRMAQAEARQARIVAQRTGQKVARYTEAEAMRRVHKDYPTLNPESKDFDPAFFDLVRDRVIRQMTQGKQDVNLAANEISKLYKSDAQKADAQAEAENKATITAKEQINASGSSTPNRGTSQEELVKGTMQGDRKSMYERMQKSGY